MKYLLWMAERKWDMDLSDALENKCSVDDHVHHPGSTRERKGLSLNSAVTELRHTWHALHLKSVRL